jgi:hypothetical protein
MRRKYTPAIVSVAIVILHLLTVSCGEKGDSDSFDGLTYFEEEILGKWSRYHGYDDSTDYLIFNTDRTMCKWTKPSSGGKKSYYSYEYWTLTEKSGGQNVFLLSYGSSKDNLYQSKTEFHFTKDEIWDGGYSNLVLSRSSSSVICED